MTAIYNMYWSSIKEGSRVYAAQSAIVQAKVKAIADAELEAGIITQDKYDKYLGIETNASDTEQK